MKRLLTAVIVVFLAFAPAPAFAETKFPSLSKPWHTSLDACQSATELDCIESVASSNESESAVIPGKHTGYSR